MTARGGVLEYQPARSPGSLRAVQPPRRRANSSARRIPRSLRLLRLVVLIVAASLAVWAGDQAAQALSDGAPQGTVHVVASGETVWGIVVAEYGGRQHDVRVLVDQVMVANNLADAQVQPGQELLLPALAE